MKLRIELRRKMKGCEGAHTQMISAATQEKKKERRIILGLGMRGLMRGQKCSLFARLLMVKLCTRRREGPINRKSAQTELL